MLETLNECSEMWGSLVWKTCWQGALALVLVWIVCRTMRRIPPAVQCWLWRLAYAKLLLGLCWLGAIELPLLSPDQPETVVSHSSREAAASPQFDKPAAELSGVMDETERPSVAPASGLNPLVAAPSATSCLMGLWLIGIIACLVRLIVQWRSIRMRIAGVTPLADELLSNRLDQLSRRLQIRRQVQLLKCAGGGTPFLTGIFRPRVVFPENVLLKATDGEREAALAHELAHVQRQDLLWNWLAAIVETLFFFHPLVWLARREWRISQESAADALAVSSGRIEVSQYAQSLLAMITRHPVKTHSNQFALGVSDAFTVLSRRLSAMKSIEPLSFSRRALTCAVLGITLLAVIPWQLTAREAQESAKEKKTPEPSEETAASESEHRTMRVRVVDQEGKPLKDAKIHANMSNIQHVITNVDLKTNAEGWVTLKVPRQLNLLRVWSTKEDYVPLFAQWWPEKQPDGHLVPEEFTFEMPHGTIIGGVVIDEQGKPVEGVRVEVIADFGRQHFQREMTERPVASLWLDVEEDAVVTDENGRWQVTNMPAGDDQNVRLKLQHPDFIRHNAWTRNTRPGDSNPSMPELRDQTARIKLDRGTRISGIVRTPAGEPVHKAVVVWGDDPYLTEGSQEVRTDVKGRYRLPPMASATVPLTVVAEGWSPFMKDVEIPEGKDELPVNIQLESGETVHIQFVNTEGEPVPEVHVGINRWRRRQSLYNHKHPNVLETAVPRKADKNGRFEWTWAPVDAVSYNFGKEHYIYQRDQRFTPRETPYEVLLLKEKSFSGKVTDADTGRPVPRFRVRPAYANGLFSFARAVPDEASEWFTAGKYRFVLDDDFPVGYVDIIAEGYHRVRSQAHALPEGEITFDVRLKKIDANE